MMSPSERGDGGRRWVVSSGELQGGNPSETHHWVLSRSPCFHLRPVRGIKLCLEERRLERGKNKKFGRSG